MHDLLCAWALEMRVRLCPICFVMQEQGSGRKNAPPASIPSSAADSLPSLSAAVSSDAHISTYHELCTCHSARAPFVPAYVRKSNEKVLLLSSTVCNERPRLFYMTQTSISPNLMGTRQVNREKHVHKPTQSVGKGDTNIARSIFFQTWITRVAHSRC